MKLKELKLTNPYLDLPAECYDRVTPSPLVKPHLIHANRELAKLLDIEEGELQTEDFVKLINGEFVAEGSDTFAMCYAGHQFGHFVPRLGDGRAINIGKVNGQTYTTKRCRRNKVFTFKVTEEQCLRSSIREYLDV
jgi:Uncharacterized conserved protein